MYYVPTANPDPYPPALDQYLNSPAVTSKIGSQSTWQETNDVVYQNFAATGDWIRSSLPDLEAVIDAGVRTVIYDGDADYILNFYGVEAMVSARPSAHHSDPTLVSAGRFFKDEVFVAVCKAEVRKLHRQQKARRSVQERRHVLIPTCFRRGTPSPCI